MLANTPILQIETLHLAFGGVVALNGVAFALETGELTALIGPNGAGKSSLLNCINGFYRPQRGSIQFLGRELTRERSHAIAALGIGRTFQNVEVLGKATVLDNVLLGRHLHIKESLFAAGIYIGPAAGEERRHRARVLEILDFLGLAAERDRAVGTLAYGRQKLVEIGRALAMEPKLLLLDEPTSGMTFAEKELVATTVRRIRAELGVTQLLIEHDMAFVSRLCGRAIVLDFGALIADGAPEQVLSDPSVIAAYLGRGLEEMEQPEYSGPSPAVTEA
jgi:branched-chain amino acid transport system ATP-binding protein